MRPLLATLLLCILACGGSAVPDATGYSDKLATFQGHSINDAIRVIGAPSRSTAGAAGHTFYVWDFQHEVQTDKVIRAERDPNGGEQYRVSGGERIPITCTVTMEADAAGQVVHTAAKGPACLIGWEHPSGGGAPVAPVEPPPVVAPVPAPTPVAAETDKAAPPAADPSPEGPRTLTPNHSGPPESATEKDGAPRRLAPARPMPKPGGKLEKR
ncbi:MAG TPA: hypothetical protein PLA94_06135 [Myxococcota bacterium]|nr:hypothetical protein [Myxococcota bacterium]